MFTCSRASSRLPHPSVRIPFRSRHLTATMLLLSAFGLAQADSTQPLSLAEAVRLAQGNAPAIAAQDAALAAADALAVRAPQLPDPQLIAGIQSLPLAGPERFSLTRDSMTTHMIGVMQEFPRREKRRLRGESAQAEAAVAGAQLAATRLDVQQQAAIAWIDAYYAQRARSLIESLRPQLDAEVSTAQAVFRGGGGSAADVLAAKAAREQLEDQLDDNARDFEQAQATLARWLGNDAAQRALAQAPDFTQLPNTPAMFLDKVEQQTSLLSYSAREHAAESQLRLARAEKKPDWSLEVGYGHRGPAYADMLSVQVRVDLPLFPGHRQDATIAARQAELDQREAERIEAVRVQREKTAQLLAAWQAATRRVERYAQTLLPLAEQRSTVALAAYRAGGSDITPLLAARNAAIQTRLADLEQQRERARAWAALNYLMPTEPQP